MAQRKPERWSTRIGAILAVVGAATCAGLLILGLAHGMWYNTVMKLLGDPPATNPHYYMWRTGWQVAAPLVAGIITGIVALFAGSQRLVVSGLIAALLQVAIVTLWWLAPSPAARITTLTVSREWQAIVIFLPLGALLVSLSLAPRPTPRPGCP